MEEDGELVRLRKNGEQGKVRIQRQNITNAKKGKGEKRIKTLHPRSFDAGGVVAAFLSTFFS